VDLYEKIDEDQTFLLAQAVAFNAFVCVIPSFLVFIALFGFFFVSSRDALERTMTYLRETMPLWDEAIVANITRVVDDRKVIGVVGFIGLFITATRLFASARTVLDIVFESPKRPGILHGKIIDVFLMVGVGSLFLLTLGVFWVASLVRSVGVRLTGVDLGAVGWVDHSVEVLIAFFFAVSAFFIVYRFGSHRKLHNRTAFSVSILAGLLWEMAKYVFGLYIAHLGNFNATYGALGTFVGLILWLYYAAIVFIIAGEIGYIHEKRRAEAYHTDG
ncbi:MAG: YihY/virulence factor BrkB family protein, partial [Candidatus Latescibacteria bacterium]|nr:YihY/virulence factor BrkB family protein [Candidatus Latescibacterota bacterium]